MYILHLPLIWYDWLRFLEVRPSLGSCASILCLLWIFIGLSYLGLPPHTPTRSPCTTCLTCCIRKFVWVTSMCPKKERYYVLYYSTSIIEPSQFLKYWRLNTPLLNYSILLQYHPSNLVQVQIKCLWTEQANVKKSVGKGNQSPANIASILYIRPWGRKRE